MVGIEVEVENVPLDTLPRFPGWSVKRDESLRNNGYEFVTDVGLRVYDVPSKLSRLFRYMEAGKKSNPGLYDFNERTSIHVHVDATRLSLDEIKNILIIYTLFEDSLFNIAGHARKHNVFCVPVRFLAMSDITYNMALDRLLGNWKKYCAINFSRIGDIGTIEFRHMEGNMDYQRVLSWVSLLTMLVDFGRMITVKGLEEEILKLKYMSNYYQFAEKVFGPFVKFIDIVPEEFDQAVSDSKFFLTLRT